MRRLNGGEIQISDVTTTTPSPYSPQVYCSAMSRNLCTRATPRWQTRASVLSLEQQVAAQSTRTGRSGGITRPAGDAPLESCNGFTPGRRAKGEEGLFDLLRELGPMTVEDLAQRHTGSSEGSSYLENLLTVKRILPAMVRGQERLACMDDAARLRDALGVQLPESLPEIYLHESVTRFATSFCAISGLMLWSRLNNWLISFSLGIAIVEEQLQQL